MGKSLQNKLFTHTKKPVAIWIPPCTWNRKHSKLHKPILCLISGITIMPASAVELEQIQETYMLKSPSVPPTAVKYPLKICHLNTDLH